MTVSEDLLDGARNLVRYAEIHAGQEVLIHTEPDYDDPEIIEAVKSAVAETGARVSVLFTPRWEKRGNKEPPPPVLEKALEGVDVLIGQGEYLYTKNRYLQVALFERGMMYIENEAKTKQALSSLYGRFPAELLFKIGAIVMGRVARAKDIHVTTEAGTNLHMGVLPEIVGGYCYPYRHDVPGTKKGFPGGTTYFHPEDPISGVLAIEAFSPSHGAPKPLMDEPLKLVYRGHRSVEMSGDCADWLREYWRTSGDGNSSWLGECMWGIHPKAGGTGARGMSNPHLMHFTLGDAHGHGAPVFSKTSMMVMVHDPTLKADGITIIDNGHLVVLDEPEVRAVAAKYGEPDELLEQGPASLREYLGYHKPPTGGR